MRFPTTCFAVALAMAVGTPVRAQWFDALINPDVEVSLIHPPTLGLKVQRVAFAPVATPAEEELVSACIADLMATGQVDVLDRSSIEKVLKEQKLTNSGLVDERSAVELGRLLGSPVLLLVSVHNLKVVRTPLRSLKTEWKDSNGKVHPAETTYTSRTQVDYSASVQAVDLASGKVFSQQRIAVSPSRETSSQVSQPEYPSETEVRELAIGQATTQVHQMILPWTETRKLVFYDDQDFGMKEAHKRLKLKDPLGALAKSQEALAQAKADPKTRRKYLGRTQYNVGICHFILGDYASAMTFLRAARETNPNHKIFREAAEACEEALRLREELAQVEARGAGTDPSRPGGSGTLEERLERLESLRKKGLITPGEYEARRAEILSEL